MENKENDEPRYEKRHREKSMKGKQAEAQAAEQDRKKKKKQKHKLSHTCNKTIRGNKANNNVCAMCNAPLHTACAVLELEDESYCNSCSHSASVNLKEHELVIEVPRNAKSKRTKAQIEENRLRDH